MAAISRTSTPRGTRAGQTQTQTQTQLETAAPTVATTQAILHLRGAARGAEEVEGDDRNTRTRRRIKWAEDVVDNEGLGRKKSKVCCIYHAPKGIDESSDESSSDSDDSDSGDDGSARPARKEGHRHGHNHDEHKHFHGNGSGKGAARGRSPNAYEKIPKAKPPKR